MSVSIIQKLAASFTDTSLPKLYRDPTIDVGSKYCFDFTNAIRVGRLCRLEFL